MPQSAYSAHSGSGGGDPSAGSVDRSGAPRASEVTALVDQEGDRMVVTVWGELGLQAEPWLRHALRSALADSTRGIDLDLSGVEFFDCATLNVLLGIRQQALEESKTVTLRAAGPAVERVLDLTDARSLFTASGADDPEQRPDPRIELVQLRRAMQTRPTIDLARGILMASFGLSPEDAWTTLVRTSQNTNIKVHHLARDLVNTVRGDALPEPVQKQLAAAVATLTHPTATPDDE
ncbi:ANTAR domain-containing protein [Streptomyces sp. NPDC002838]|uniref:ANTAR domain-containing protein n=1 Tax=Streptomyces sp. NPDC002838 TaxID=3154436 RepID=UPI00332FEC9D